MDRNELVRTCVACGKCQGYELFATQGVPDGLDCETAQKWAESESARNNVESGGKLYHVYYASKFDGTQKDYVLDVRAESAKEARDTCWKLVHDATGRHAFTIKAMLTDKRPIGYAKEVTKGYPPPKI